MLEQIRHDDILELRLARPPVNALDAGLIRALREDIEAAPGAGVRGIILSGRAGMFSGGLDVPSLLQLDRAGMGQTWRDLFGTCAALARSPIPSVAAITGHSPAGGAVLSIFCDYRVMARGAYRIGLNEVQVGLVVPEPIQRGLRRLVGNYRAERLMVAGAMLDSEQALAAGFVDELVDVDHVVARAQLWLKELLNLPPRAMSGTRQLARADLADSFGDVDTMNVDEFVDGWFSEESQRILSALVAKLKAKQ
ncbi:enoyl-CoA hydratase/isomerase family protein [Tahibacter harae]|uniref:Enoyl-CoA hydratase/isomerase family protein n=1 Tax=Tahibacter harae TaxID=2963937 RepID=A0ABT1QMN0_9GAMM|nr:enoyl-CoA hydratase/isomerase family protein [Tahibacter harae]MCQ4163795.1 enoyl-CoA hydratase/isomerase family protein [Tahibacter harae]